MRSTDCNVHLCVNCYQLFHVAPNIVDKKKQMEKVFLQEERDRAAQMENMSPDNVKEFSFNVNIQEIIDECKQCKPVEL
jgi:hypothetical protein